MQYNANKKKETIVIPDWVKSSICLFVVIIICLAVTLPIHFVYPEKLSSYWVIVINVAIIFPVALENFKNYVFFVKNASDEQKKKISKSIRLSIVDVWYLDFVFVCWFMNWAKPFYILGSICLIKNIYKVTSILFNREKESAYPNFIIIGDYVFSFIVLIAILEKIQDEKLREILIPITAALLGGTLTLLGVMLTIKHNEIIRKEEERIKNKPLLIIIEEMAIGVSSITTNKHASASESSDKSNLGFIIKNISTMPCRLHSVIYLNREILFEDRHSWVEGNETVWITVQISNLKYDGEITLIIEDIAVNRYEYLLKFDSVGAISSMKELCIEGR